LINDITDSFYVNICRGLFEKDKLIYSFLNASGIIRRDGRITFAEWNYFVRGPLIKQIDSPINYLDSLSYLKIKGLEEIHANFIGLTTSFEDAADSVYWKDIVTSNEPWKCSFPPKYD
jgi:dynein heavy chain